MARDIVAQGRTTVRFGIALMVVPQLAIVVRAFVAGSYQTGGLETARLAVWAGFLYLVYLGFRNPRVLISLYTIVFVALILVALSKAVGHAPVAYFLWPVAYVTLVTAGLLVLLFHPAARAFYTYQRGGTVPYPPVAG